MDIVIKPLKKPPPLKESDCLSHAARQTITSLEQKYHALAVSMLSVTNRNRNDSAEYYKRIYENNFKKELISHPQEVSFEQKSSLNQKHPWQISNFKKYTCSQDLNFSTRPKESNEKTPQRSVLDIDSPLIEIEMDDVFECDTRRSSDHQVCGKQTISFTSSQSQTAGQECELNKTDSKKTLLMKWNRKFSQTVSQFEDRQEKAITRKDIDSELMWIDNLYSQQEKNCSDYELFHTTSSLSDSCGNQKGESVSVSKDPFTVFSLVDQDCIDDNSDTEQNETPNVYTNSKRCSDGMECTMYESKHHQPKQPPNIANIPDLFSSPNINEKYFETVDQSLVSKDAFSIESVQTIDDYNLSYNDEKKRNIQAFGTSICGDVIPEEKKRKAHDQCSKKRMLASVQEDPLFVSKSNVKADIRNVERKSDNGVGRQKTVKRFKSGFKPPTKDQSESCGHQQKIMYQDNKSNKNKTAQSSRDAQSGLANVIDYFALSSEKKYEVVDNLNSTQHISLTIVIANGKSLVNVFDEGIDCTKDPSVIMLTSDNNCYQLTINTGTLEDVKTILIQVLCNGKCEIVMPNSKKFLSSLYKILHVDSNNIMTCETLEDPVLASWLLNPDKPPTSFSMMCQTANLKFAEAKDDWLSCLYFTKRLMNSLKKRLEGDDLLKLYKGIEIKLVPVLACMENRSLKVDIAIFRKYADILKSKLHKLEESAFKEVGHKFTINSHPQLRQILYEELKLDEKLPPNAKIGKTSVSHHKSTCESSLLLLAGLHPLPTIILEYRSLQKLKSTYIDGMLSCMSNNLITTHWDQTSAATGRITSYQPNIQNIPKTVVVVEDYLPNTILGSAPKSSAQIYARKPFICHDGFVFLAADFQQIELRILAHLSDDKALLSMFWNPDSIDVFKLLTAEWKNIAVDKVSIEERETTKRIVYSVMYGVGKEKLAVYLKVKPDIAKEIMKNFLDRFPAIDSFTKKCCSYAKEYGYTETICGRRRYFPYINSSSPALRAQAQRQAVNFCVQGSAADICKLAMLEVESSLKKHLKLDYRLLLQIHDELLWEVAEDQLLEVKEIIESVMENAKALCQKFCSLQVPLSVSFSQGRSWAHLSPHSEI